MKLSVYTLTLKESDSYNNEEVMSNAADFANDNVGSMYDVNFINNKDNDYTKLNCSELIWAAYYEAGIDLDSDGVIGVYPNDISNSEYLEVDKIY